MSELKSFEESFELTVMVKPLWGVDIKDCYKEALQLSNTLGIPIVFVFNYVLVKVKPKDNLQDLIDKYSIK